MAVRVRKLAREIRRSPAEVLGLLHALGFSKYKSAEDMVADLIANKARKAVQQGMKAEAVIPVNDRTPIAKAKAVSSPRMDTMGALVAGVVQNEVAPPPVSESPAAIAEKVKIAEERDALKRALAIAKDQCLVLETERDALRLQRDTVTTATPVSQPSLRDLFEARGLVDAAEQRLAILAMVDHHWGREFVLEAQPRQPEELTQVLSQRLLLVDGAFPELHGCVTIPVSAERAEIPGGDEVRQSIRAVGEGMMLNGLKRMCAVGVSPRWQKLLRAHIDERVAIRFLPGGERDVRGALNDCEGVDLVWTWDPVHAAEVIAIYQGSSAAWAKANGQGLVQAIGALNLLLNGDEEHTA